MGAWSKKQNGRRTLTLERFQMNGSLMFVHGLTSLAQTNTGTPLLGRKEGHKNLIDKFLCNGCNKTNPALFSSL